MTELSRRSPHKTGLIKAATAAGASAGSVTAGAATKEPKMVYDVVVVAVAAPVWLAAIEAKRKGYNVCILDKMSCPAGNSGYLCRRHYQRRRHLPCETGRRQR